MNKSIPRSLIKYFNLAKNKVVKFEKKLRCRNLLNTKKNDGKINLCDQLIISYGPHRSGWLYAINSIKELHNPQGILFDSFIERTFTWNLNRIKPHLVPWIGVTHVPPGVPKWFLYEQTNESIFKTEAWQKSLPYCKGLFTLSRYHKKYLEKKVEIPVNDLFFATKTPKIKWTWEKFKCNPEKKIIQVGWWLRKLHTIFQLRTSKYKKIFLRVNHRLLDDIILKEREILERENSFNESMYQTAKTLSFLSNKKYDKLISENIVLLNLYDSSANNLISECMVRNTPILVNPLEAVLEYLGDDYPLYFNSMEEASKKAEDWDLIYEAYQYLLNHPSKEKLRGEYFLKSFKESRIYKNI